MKWAGGAVTAGLVAAGVAATALRGSRDYRVVAHRVPVLPTGANRVRVLHISDEHYRSENRALADFVSRLADLAPDLVVSTGDSLICDAALDDYLHVHQRLLSVPGVFVFGSNDYYESKPKNPLRYLTHRLGRNQDDKTRTAKKVAHLEWKRLRSAFESAGWVDLTNQAWVTELAGLKVAFKGTDDAHLDRDDYPSVAGPVDEVDIKLGVTHAPYRRVLDAMVEDGMSMVFAGHTHGGQVCRPGGRAIVTNCDLPTAMASGLHRYSTAWLHVSPGLGTSPYTPFRLNCPPAACVLDLVAIDAAE